MKTALEQLLSSLTQKGTSFGENYLINTVNKYTPSPFQGNDIKKIFSGLDNGFRQIYGNKISEFFLAGSRVKGTALASSSDLDLVIVFRSNTFSTIQEMYKSVHGVLKQAFGTVRVQNVSLGITIGTRKIDITPAKRQRPLFAPLSLRNNRSGTHVESHVKRHIPYVVNSGKRREIKAFKIWNCQRNLGLDSFLIEVAVIEAIKGLSFLFNMQTRVNSVLNYFVNDFPSSSLIDPFKPSNILSNEVTKVTKEKVAAEAERVLSSSSWSDFIY